MLALGDLIDDVPTLLASGAAERAAARIEAASLDLANAEATGMALADLANEAPTLTDMSAAIAASKRLADLKQALEKAEADASAATEAARDAATEVADTLDAMGNLCPLCGSHVEHDHFLHAETV
jgi:DNA repair exonuclease SbcCD ATPase subunit